MSDQIVFIERGRSAKLGASAGTIISVTPGRKARLASIIATCTSGEATINIFDGASGYAYGSGTGVPVLQFTTLAKVGGLSSGNVAPAIVNANTEFRAGEDELVGVEFYSGVVGYVLTAGLSGTPFIHIGIKEY